MMTSPATAGEHTVYQSRGGSQVLVWYEPVEQDVSTHRITSWHQRRLIHP